MYLAMGRLAHPPGEWNDGAGGRKKNKKNAKSKAPPSKTEGRAHATSSRGGDAGRALRENAFERDTGVGTIGRENRKPLLVNRVPVLEYRIL